MQDLGDDDRAADPDIESGLFGFGSVKLLKKLSGFPQDKLSSRSLLMVKKLSTESFIKEAEDDDSVEDSSNMIVSHPVENPKFVEKTVNWSQWKLIKSRMFNWGIMSTISFLTSLFCKLVFNNNYIYSGLALWVWLGLPFAVMVTYVICDAFEFLLLFSISYTLHDKSWTLRGFIASLRHFFGVIGFCLVIKEVIFPLITVIDSDSVSGSGHEVLNKILLVVSVIPIWSVFIVVRDVLYLMIRVRITSQSYKHAINDLMFMENVCNRFCSSIENAMRIRGELHQHTHVMDRIDSITKGCLKLPLESRHGGVWTYSETHEVTLLNDKEMVTVSLIIFDNFLVSPGSKSVSFEIWCRYFSNTTEASRAFRLFFDNDCWSKQSFDETDFAKALVRLFQRRCTLRDQLQKFESTARLLLNIADIPYFFLFIFTVALLAGISLSVVAVSCSAIVVSFSFALGPSIERVVSSIAFIFGSKPYEVNDLVEIDGQVYCVNALNLTQTTFSSGSGKLCMMHHSVLIAKNIINLSRSANASSKFEFEVESKTPIDKIDKLRKMVRKAVLQDPIHWRPNVRFRYDRFEGKSNSIFSVCVTSTLPWRSIDTFKDAEFELRSSIMEKVHRLKLD